MSEWVAVSLKTGDIITDLPLLEVSDVAASMGRYESTTAELPIATGKVPPEWRRATSRGAAALILLDDNPNDPTHGIPVWGGWVKRRRRTQLDKVSLDLQTIDGYFDERYVGDKTYAGVAQCLILKDLVESFAKVGSNGGIPIRVVVLGDNGQVRDRTYVDVQDKTLYSAIRELSDVNGGPEWYCEWEWQYNPDRLTPVMYVGNRLGSTVPAGLAPAAVFDLPGSIRDFEFVEDYGHGRGANDVMATAAGEGDTRPQSSHAVYTDTERPTFEFRFSPSSSITETSTLDAHAQRRLSQMQQGTESIVLTAHLSQAPRLRIDWNLGDTVGISLGGTAYDGRDQVPATPGGLSGMARVAGWKRTLEEPQTISPIVIAETGAFDAAG